ncbi:MAG: phytanoyl-CoA dioxygenase family protein [bacterium]|nr:phytanoyl-CoA dioxygenase family protein [bacterium]
MTDLFADPRSKSKTADVDDFERSGFLTGLPILSGTQVNALREALDDLIENHAEDPLFYEYKSNESKVEGNRLLHALGAWRISPSLHDLIFYRPIIEIAEQLLGGSIRFWHDQVFLKPAGDGAVVAWHQDYSYWTRTVPLAHLTCWIGLDDSDEENGCVQYVPGSHRWHLLPRGDLANDMTAVFQHLNAEQKDAFHPTPAVMKAGEASFHHPMTVHGSYENRSDRPRRGIVLNFMRDGVRSNTNEPLLAGVPVIPMGQKLEGQFFPLLSAAE